MMTKTYVPQIVLIIQQDQIEFDFFQTVQLIQINL